MRFSCPFHRTFRRLTACASNLRFFSEEPTPHDPFVHVMVGSLPPSRQSLVTPRGCETSGWTPIGSPDEADGTIHFTVSHPGFWPVTVVFDANSNDLGREDNVRAVSFSLCFPD